MSIQFCVPQESALGPLLFTLDAQSLVKIKERLSLHFHRYADGT